MSIFNSVQLRKVKRSKFDLSHEVKLSTDMGKLTPILCEDVLPGDTWNVKSEVFIRVAPLLAPIMHRVNCYIHHFFVPYRLLWDEWEQFIVGPKGKGDTTEVIKPRFKVYMSRVPKDKRKHFAPGSLLDYLGFPVYREDDLIWSVTEAIYDVDAMPLMAYYLIWKEYYRDQNLTDTEKNPLPYSKDCLESGVTDLDFTGTTGGNQNYSTKEIENLFNLQYRCWEKDYFTSALPWPQKGPDVELPLTGDADVYLTKENGTQKIAFANNNHAWYNATDKELNMQNGQLATKYAKNGEFAYDNIVIDPNGTLKADVSSVNATTINELRRASALQRWLERNALGGNRYIETLLNHFGVRSSDARLQRPEYLGGGKTPIVISEVLQQSQTVENGDNPSALGDYAGTGGALGSTHQAKRYFEEHGYIMSIMSIIPRSCYQNGLPRKYQKWDKFDYAWPEFAHLGEQQVMNSELYYNPAGGTIDEPGTNQKEFGYQSRYAEYKYLPSRVCGDMRDQLSFWHLGRQFTTLPSLNQNFVTIQPEEVDRIYAVTDGNVDHLWCQIYHNIKCKRKLPYYGTPL